MVSRSVYLARLRRAFLLRVHPDRFRSTSRRREQAALVQALAVRMDQPDFWGWQQQRGTHVNSLYHQQQQPHTFPYVLEKRDGSLYRTSLSLNASVDSILASMVAALKASGTATLPEPPAASSLEDERQRRISKDYMSSLSSPTMFEHENGGVAGGGVDERYDIMSRKGRDLLHFLRTTVLAGREDCGDDANGSSSSNTTANSIRQLQASRTDAQAAALMVRRLYQFQAVDATSLGWSSASVAVLLRRLVALHHEHEFRVASFYPIRLVFSKINDHHQLDHIVREDDRDRENADADAVLDIYGGLLRLNPASTPLQWLESLRLVTAAKLQEIQTCRQLTMERSKLLQGVTGVKFKKGFTCSNRDYYYFLEHLATSCCASTTTNAALQQAATTTTAALTIEPLLVTVEAAHVCHRRPLVTPQGTIRLGASMTLPQVQAAVERLSHQARQQRQQHEQANLLCQQAIQQVKWQLGLQKVYRASGMVSHEEFLNCLGRLLAVASNTNNSSDEAARQTSRIIQHGFGGHSVGIAGTGQFCHLADDGSLVIPHNWR